MTISDFIKKRPYLIWWVKDYSKLGPESVVEATLNYGDWDDVQELIDILGIKEVEKIFRVQTTNRMRINYDRKIMHYFRLYFNKYA